MEILEKYVQLGIPLPSKCADHSNAACHPNSHCLAVSSPNLSCLALQRWVWCLVAWEQNRTELNGMRKPTHTYWEPTVESLYAGKPACKGGRKGNSFERNAGYLKKNKNKTHWKPKVKERGRSKKQCQRHTLDTELKRKRLIRQWKSTT